MKIYGDGGHASVVRSIPLSEFQVDGSIVAIGNNYDRKRVVETEAKNDTFAILIHPFSFEADDVVIGEGTVIMAGAVVQPGCIIGKHVILNTGCTIDHGCVIGDYAHIAPGAHLCGDVRVGEGALMGVGSCAVPGAVIPPWSLVKAGSVAK